MVTPYRKRYQGHEEDIRKDVRSLGVIPAQQRHGARDLIAWERYVQELMGDEKYSHLTEAARSTTDQIYEKVASKIIDKILTLESENQELRAQLATFRHQKELRDEVERFGAARLLQVLG